MNKNKEDLIEAVREQIEIDVHCKDMSALEEMLSFIPTEILIAYLPEHEWKQFKHLNIN